MKNYLILLSIAFSFCFAPKVFAQPTFTLNPDYVKVDPDANVCLAVKVKDFTDILSVQFTIAWDPGVVEFQNITGLNGSVTGLDMGDFNVTNAANGYITLNWSNGQPCATATSGVTLPDNSNFFILCFKATGEYGNHTPVYFTDTPMDRNVKRLMANCIDIGEIVEDGWISIGADPLTINISAADGFQNDIVCVDFKVEDFQNLVSNQYFIYWNPAILEYQSHVTSNLSGNYFVNPSPTLGMMSSLWYTNNITQGVSLPDGTQILQICFKVIGTCGQSSPITIGENINSMPNEPIEVIDQVTGSNPAGTNIGLLYNQGEVTVNCLDPDGITINVEDKNVCPGESFTIDLKVEDFAQISKLQFNLKWNKDIIQYDGVEYPNSPTPCTPFSNGVDASAASAGILEMDWTNASLGCNKPDGYILMRLKFKAIGPSGTNTTIAIVNPILVDKFGGQVENIGLNNNNGLVTLCELDKPTIVASSIDGKPGETVCIDFTVQDFEDLVRFQTTIVWEPTILEFQNVQGFNLAGLGNQNFYSTEALTIGVLGMEWGSIDGVSVPDGTTIFSICFTIIGDPDECATINFDEVPWAIDVKTTESNNTNVGLNGQPGQVCVLDPFIFGITVPEVYGGEGAVVCLPITVENFLQLTNTEYSINWEPDVIQFLQINPSPSLPSFNALSYDASLAAGGQLVVDWAATSQVLGFTVPNGESMYEICFTVVGEALECTPVTITEVPAFITINSATTGPANLGISIDNGEVCVSGSIQYNGATITDVVCGGNPTGAIVPDIIGGSGQYTYQWTGPGVDPDAPTQSGLNVGSYAVTVTDAQNPTFTVSQTFVVTYAPNATIADAGIDTTFSCGSFQLTLNGSGSTVGPNITYQWGALGNGLVPPPQVNLMNPTIVGGSKYVLTVTNTASGCVSKDTVSIATAVKPQPDIADMLEVVSCKNDTLSLDGSGSPLGFQNNWTTPDGAVVPGTETEFIAQITAPGWYYFTQSNPATGCSGVDSILVDADLDLPIADAGENDSLGCNEISIPIGGASSTGARFVYDWNPVGASQLCGNPQSPVAGACSAGMFELTVTDTVNGCVAVDVVEVVSDTLKPVANAGLTDTLTCLADTLTLDGSASSNGGNYSYTWTALGTGAILTGQGTVAVTVQAPDTYQLQVVNNDNGCESYAEVIIAEDKDFPAAAAAASNEITCLLTDATLDATGSAAGPNIQYAWLNSANASVGTGQTITVSNPGDYTLVVTDMGNGCESTTNVAVVDNDNPPTVDAGTDATITCIEDQPMLVGAIDQSNPNVLVQWSGPGLGCIVSGNTPSTEVSCDGTYTLTAIDTLTGCINSDQTMVTPDLTAPVAEAGNQQTISCLITSVELQGTSDVQNVSVQWTSIPANMPISDPTSLTTTVTEPATYVLIVTSNTNGCTSSADLVLVFGDTVPPIADAGVNDTIDCQITTADLSASGSTLTGTTLLWELENSSFTATTPDISVMEEGIYQLTVTNTGNGCAATATVEVVNIGDLPNIVVDETVEIGCDGTPSQLDGTGTDAGAGISYVWSNLATGAIVGSDIITTVSDTGTYVLTVANSTNNCMDTAHVSVVLANNGEAAQVTVNHDPCAPDAELVGNLPAGATGVWTSPTGAEIADPTAATTTATGLVSGQNTFVWTLTLGSCTDYSSATGELAVEQAAPNAVNDQTSLLPSAAGQISFNVLDNDIFNAGNAVFTLLENSGLIGSATATDDGTVTYKKEKCFAGKAEILYSLCDPTCPDLCDTAALVVTVEVDPAEDCDEVPNGITPNGDGVNDELVFDQILSTPEEDMPDNEIIIFNRWGDIVYQAKPYQNDWRGVNQSGDDLPHGTYYYILRLNIADGNILKGDITILK